MVYIDEFNKSCIVVKSEPKNYIREIGEIDRIKNNTYRYITESEQSHEGLIWDEKYNWLYVERPNDEDTNLQQYPLLYITIKNTNTDKYKTFNITDIHRIDKTHFIFTFDVGNIWNSHKIKQHFINKNYNMLWI